MTSSGAFYKLINLPWFLRFVDRKRKAVEAINPSRIYVENVRAFFGFPYALARLLLDIAAREGALERKVGVLCPYDKHIVASFSSEEGLPESVFCVACEAAGRDETEHHPAKMERITFYKLPTSKNG